jgi:hypothetical protein
MEPTLRNLGQDLKITAHHEYEECGFEGRRILVKLGGAAHPRILASTIISESGDGSIQANINVNPRLAELSPEKQKMVLAHEWIHAMIAFRDETTGNINSMTQAEMLIFSGWLKRRSIWFDSAELSADMHTALRELLVSRASIEEMLSEDFKMTDRDLAALVRNDPNGAYQVINTLAPTFAGKWSVDENLVFDRLREIVV